MQARMTSMIKCYSTSKSVLQDQQDLVCGTILSILASYSNPGGESVDQAGPFDGTRRGMAFHGQVLFVCKD